MQLNRKNVAVFLVPFLFLAGCAGKPGSIEDTSLNPFRTAPASAAPLSAPHRSAMGMQRIESMLHSTSETDRIAACEILGNMAETQAGDLLPIEMLAETMQSDASMKVRTAATNALGAMQTVSRARDLEGLIPSEALPPTEKTGFLQRLLR